MVTAYAAFLGLIAIERLGELVRSRRNAAWSFERGGIEVGKTHFRVMALAHTLLLPACLVEVVLLDRPFIAVVGVPMLVLVVAAQLLRVRVISTLGPRWNVRTIVVPGLPPVTDGLYRWVRHPNYAAVIVEGFAIPLVHSAWITAAAFTAINIPILITRIRCEEAALAEYSDREGRLEALPRFIPRAAPGAGGGASG